MNIFTVLLIIVGAWQIIFSLIMQTKNLKSSMVYKVIPFFSGLYCIFYGLMQSGIINISL